MKLIFTQLLVFLAMWTNAQNKNFHEQEKTVCTFRLGEDKIILKEKSDTSSFRENADRVKFYKTRLLAVIENKGRTTSKLLDSSLYITEEYHKTMLPCILVDSAQKLVYVFSNSKSLDLSYGMDGFVYQSNLGFDSLKKEMIFTGFNAGWSSFFGGSFRGNPELWHYSAAGGFVILSKRKADNKWLSDVVGDINPQLVERQYDSHKNILFATLPNMDSMKFY